MLVSCDVMCPEGDRAPRSGERSRFGQPAEHPVGAIVSEARPIGPAMFTPLSCETYIYQDKGAMFIFRDEILAFIVDSSDFTQLMHWQFETIWATL